MTRHHDWKRIGNALRGIYAEIASNPTQQPASDAYFVSLKLTPGIERKANTE